MYNTVRSAEDEEEREACSNLDKLWGIRALKTPCERQQKVLRGSERREENENINNERCRESADMGEKRGIGETGYSEGEIFILVETSFGKSKRKFQRTTSVRLGEEDRAPMAGMGKILGYQRQSRI